MELFKTPTQINFLAKQSLAAIISTLLFCLSIAAIEFKGLNWGFDFTGGLQAQFSFKEPIEIIRIQQALNTPAFPKVKVQPYENTQEVLATFIGVSFDEEAGQKIKAMLKTALPNAKLQRFDFIGPKEGQALLVKGIFALLVALVAVAIYISLRFEKRLAIGAAVALIHDPILTLGFFAWFQIEFNLIALAGLLTVIGYSLNNIIVILDRIRENFKKADTAMLDPLRKEYDPKIEACSRHGIAPGEKRNLSSINEHRSPSLTTSLGARRPFALVNLSINETLSRTLITSGISLSTACTLYYFGGHDLHSFALTLITGILVGSYSAIYIAGGLAVALGLQPHHMLTKPFFMDDKP